jgi:hypothetical protein
MTGAKYELDNGRSIALISGSLSLGAGSHKLTNANMYQQKSYQRTPLGERAGDPHPSRGAISPFYGKCMFLMIDDSTKDLSLIAPLVYPIFFKQILFSAH